MTLSSSTAQYRRVRFVELAQKAVRPTYGKEVLGKKYGFMLLCDFY
jgi:hypothetical protein